MFSKFFINRPIFAIVIAIAMILAGLLTVKTLPVAQFPDITPPTVMVSASYPGADATTVAKTIGVPIEQQVNGVEGMMYMSSSSGSDGSYNLTITFENGTDPDMAAVKVQNLISEAEATLPSAVRQQGVQVMSRSSNIILFVALESDDPKTYDALYLTNYAQLNIVDELSRVDGVGQVGAFGAGEYSMRIWLDPDLMRVRNITATEVTSAISSQNMQVSAGNVGQAPGNNDAAFEYTLTAQGRLTTPEEFGNMVIRVDSDGSMLRLKDIARIDLGSSSYTSRSTVSGQPAGLLGVYQLPGANALTVAKNVKAKLNELSEYFPEGVHYRVILDTSEFVTASIDEVLVTFVETTLIVMIVILFFLQSWRAVIIPMITIPVALIATFAVMKLMGFTLNTLTLFGLVLAIAIVVDDAIVVVEDCARIVQEGKLSPREATAKAMEELQGPVIGEVLVLLSVFIPTAFISGITGQLYKQFALTIAVSTAFSGFSALTLTPALCALFLRKDTVGSRFFLFRWFEKGFGATLNFYMKIVGKFLKRPAVAICIYAAVAAVAFWGFMKLPSSYVPEEDMGYFMGSVELPTGASLERTNKIMDEVTARLMKFPEVENVISISGFSFLGGGSGSNLGALSVVLKPWKDRKGKDHDVESVIRRFEEVCADIQEAQIFGLNPPSIPGLGMASGIEMQLLDINNRGAAQMKTALEAVAAAARKNPEIASVSSLYQGEVPQFKLNIDRDKVKSQGIVLADIYTALGAFTGSSYVNDFNEFGRAYEVIVSGKSTARDNVEDVLNLSVRNSEGKMVPFSSFLTVDPVMGESTVSRYNMYRTASITATPAKGTSTGTAIKIMEDIVKEELGAEYSYAWTGEAYQQTQGGTTITMVMLFAIIITLLVLAAQYESLTDPVAVVISMPTAILGTVLGCVLMGQSVSVYTQIGVILLLGLSAKNAILIVEYAVDFRKSGQPIRQAALDAGRIRYRPIMMTALAFVFGVMPMLFATGAGAASRIALGTAVVFGMAVNAIVGTLFVPNFWELLERFREKYLSGIFGSKTPPPTPPSTSGNTDTPGSDSI
ncbi:MAG: multidrug efflux RND transporter permease subunit [Firmicutes bacterium]|nr:multidrug efflux RND transporter permease subunit [Bacillota bacterium]MCM1401176.1 multidrug efflux RND transporter permease subunit [Bacteroides sp.]MCM1477127.1 multidrug efflux RND transporter permease subunit [Bacteroides sp.]